MNSKTTIIGLVAAIAVLSGAMGLSVTGAFSDQTIAQTTIPATGFLMGQVIIEAHNADGELIAYRIGDNEVVDDGEQCILKMLFATAVDGGDGVGRGGVPGTDVCTGALTGAWQVIAIGVGDTGHGQSDCSGVGAPSLCDVATHDVMTGLETECSAAENVGTPTCLADASLARATATTKSWANGSGTGATQIVLANTFTSSSSSTTVITESGLFNSTTINSGGMLSHKTFSAVSLTDGDSITVTWTFTVGN